MWETSLSISNERKNSVSDQVSGYSKGDLEDRRKTLCKRDNQISLKNCTIYYVKNKISWSL